MKGFAHLVNVESVIEWLPSMGVFLRDSDPVERSASEASTHCDWIRKEDHHEWVTRWFDVDPDWCPSPRGIGPAEIDLP